MKTIKEELGSIDNRTLGRSIKEYVEESAHGGWEGFDDRDLIGISRFLRDLLLYSRYCSWCGEFDHSLENCPCEVPTDFKGD
jgi:hypothetical protein